MADINTYLNQISASVYGKDVRGAIVNGIKQCYADGVSGATDQQARADIDSLKNNFISDTNFNALWETIKKG